jgi:hypothetical protein
MTCECGRPTEDHSFKELLVCLYSDEGMTEAKAGSVIDGITERVTRIEPSVQWLKCEHGRRRIDCAEPWHQ